MSTDEKMFKLLKLQDLLTFTNGFIEWLRSFGEQKTILSL